MIKFYFQVFNTVMDENKVGQVKLCFKKPNLFKNSRPKA